MERRSKVSWLPVETDWSEEGRDNGVFFQVRDGIKFWCDSESESESEELDPDDQAMALGFMCCNGCQTIKPPEQFHASMKEKRGDEVLCLTCTGAPVTKSEGQSFHCYGVLCQGQSRPAYHFIDAMLTEWRIKGTTVNLQCVRCFVRSPDYSGKKNLRTATFSCVGCETKKPIMDGGPVTIKDWIHGRRNNHRWRCFECQYPSCTKCQKQPLHAVPHNAMVDGKYYCEGCRYPPCACGSRRGKFGGQNRFKPYTCPECVERKRSCSKCQKAFTLQPGFTPSVPYCSIECRYPKCKGRSPNGKPCQNERTSSRAYGGNKPRWDQQEEWYCQRCQDTSGPASSAPPPKKHRQSTEAGESLETKKCQLCKQSRLTSETELRGTQHYCRACLDEEFTCGGPTGCGHKSRRRDGHFNWNDLKELRMKKRKSLCCKTCRGSRKK
jgi:hypothetical protein